MRAVFAIVADESDARPGEYWTKTYVGPIQPDGSFKVNVSEPAEAGGVLKTWFVFMDGSATGNGKLIARDGAIPNAYTYGRQRWIFK